MRIARRTLLALIMGMVVLLAAVSPQAGYAESGEEGEKDSFYLLIHALRYAEEKSLFNDDGHLTSLTESLTEWFATEAVNPNAPVSAEQTRDRETLLLQIEYHPPRSALIETLLYLRKYDLLNPHLSEVIADGYIERIAELTGDTPEDLRELLTGRIALEMSDRAALVALYNATDGDNWADNTNWLSDLPIHRWYGINAYDGRVLSLNLNDNGLSGKIPREMGSLSELRYLNLSLNDLNGQIPIEVSNLPNLQEVALWGNRFTGCVPGSLYYLWFSATPAASSDNPFLYWFDDLYKLDLPSCGQTKELSTLYEATDGANWTDNTNWMSDRPIGEWHGVTTDNRSNVIKLELDDNNLNGRIPPELGGISLLKYLSLSGNQLSGDIPPELGDLSELGSLNLFGNRLSEEIPPELGKLSNLKSLSLGGNRLGGCIPEGLSHVPRIDISALGVPFCGSGSGAPLPSLALAAFSPSPTRMNLFWVNNLEAESVTIYRNGAPVATPTLDLFHYTDSGLIPNVRYEYRIGAILADDSVEVLDEYSAATMALPPGMVEVVDVNESGFTLVIADNPNPPGTEYRGVLTESITSREYKAVSDWSVSKCVIFEGLEPDVGYYPRAVARNLDGIESEPGSWIYDDYDNWPVQTQPGSDDPWAIYKINEAADLYGLTEAGRQWMLSDIRVKYYRNEPGYAGYSPREAVAGVGNARPGSVAHEIMHGYTHHWTGFPLPCDVMNAHTFKRDVARFILDFRNYDLTGQPNPLEDWRPFYNSLIRDLEQPHLYGEDLWKLLQQGDYRELDAIYHFTDTDIPSTTAGKMSLIPPTLRPQFQGFLVDDSDAATWRDELYWYSSLPPQERRLWDTGYNYHGVLNFSPQYATPRSATRTNIPAEKLELLRKADRRILVDFINTLEDISCNTEDPCKELWRADFDFWTGYVRQNLYRARLYLEELSADTGIELAPANLDAVRGILRAMVAEVSCGSARPSYLRGYINSATGVSELQRNALLAMVDVLERDPDWYLPCGSEAALAEAWPVAPHRIHHHDHRAPDRWRE